MKITVIGAGSTYTPELVSGFLAQAGRLPLTELCLMDIDPARLEIVGNFARRMVATLSDPFSVTLTLDLPSAIRGASYVITQFRVGQMPARIRDEYLGLRHGLIGQETTGIGGMAKALRTIPPILQIAAEMRTSAPHALLLNFTNPSGVVTEALTRYAPEISSVGVCNVGITTKMKILEQVELLLGTSIAPERAALDSLGLNHLTWHRGFTIDGEDYWPRLFPILLAWAAGQDHPIWDVPTLTSLNMLPNDYLQYYYYTAQKLSSQQKWPPSRGEEVLVIEQDLLRQYSDPALTSPPADLMKRGGAYYSTLATRLIDSHYNDLGHIEIVNTPNHGAVAGWPADWVLELPCRIDRQGIHPLPAQPLPHSCFGLLSHVKAYELLTVEAAVHGDRDAAYQALLAHPLGPPADQIQPFLEDMLATHREYLPRFFK